VRAMNLTIEKITDYSVVTVGDERIDAHNSDELKQSLLRMIDGGDTKLVIKLQQVRFIDSSGLGALLSANKHVALKSGKLVLAGIQKQVLAMFELTRLNRVFEIYSDIDEALTNNA
jgi:anti-sigma B factor antagonist